jgi:hypothetical protein
MKTKGVFVIAVTVPFLAADSYSADVAPAKTVKTVRLLTVGDAFYRADTNPQWGFRPDTEFDFQKAQPPALPDQTHSLHIGWRWAKQQDGQTKLSMDGHHANTAGEYLGACVFYEVLFGDSVVGNPFVPPGLEPAYARFLQQTAHQAVMDSGA